MEDKCHIVIIYIRIYLYISCMYIYYRYYIYIYIYIYICIYYIYSHLSRNAIVRLFNSPSGDWQGQETVFAPSTDNKQTHNNNTERSKYHPSQSGYIYIYIQANSKKIMQYKNTEYVRKTKYKIKINVWNKISLNQFIFLSTWWSGVYF